VAAVVGTAAAPAAAVAMVLWPPPCLFFFLLFIIFFLKVIFNVYTMFNKKKLQVPKAPQVSYNTAEIMGHDRCYPPQVTVLTGTGAVWENPTRGIPHVEPY